MLVKTNIPGFYKDDATQAVINKNMGEYEQYKAARQKLIELNTMNEKFDEMSTELSEVKELLKQLLKQGK